MLTLLDEIIVDLVYGKCNPFVVAGVLCATWHKVIPKLDFKIKTFGLIQKCWNNHTTKMMATKRYHAKLNYNGSIQKW